MAGNAPLPQLLAHHPGQGAALGLGDVGDAQKLGVRLFPVPRAEMMGMPLAWAVSMRSSLQLTRSMASTI